MLIDKSLRRIIKMWYYFFVNFFKHLYYSQTRGFYYLFWLRNADFLHDDACLLFDVLNHNFLPVCIKCNTSTFSSCTGRSSRSMNVCFCIFGWFDLDYKVNCWNIKSTGSNICCNKYLKLFLFKSFKSNLSLILGNVTMHHFNLRFYFFRKDQ